MILIGLSILAAIGLLALIVWALHRNQRIENQESVDRNLPLPPIELKQSDANELSDVEDMLGIEPAPRPAPVTTTVELSETIPSPDQWLVRSREYAAQGDFESALQQCQSALPQMGAFRQSCVVLRAQIRELKKQQQSYTNALEQLYRFASQADFFHGKTANTNALPPSAVKQIDYAAWKSLSSPYAVLGYEHVSLLTKTDAKWLVKEWGEPESHGFMRELHLAQWNTL